MVATNSLERADPGVLPPKSLSTLVVGSIGAVFGDCATRNLVRYALRSSVTDVAEIQPPAGSDCNCQIMHVVSRDRTLWTDAVERWVRI